MNIKNFEMSGNKSEKYFETSNLLLSFSCLNSKNHLSIHFLYLGEIFKKRFLFKYPISWLNDGSPPESCRTFGFSGRGGGVAFTFGGSFGFAGGCFGASLALGGSGLALMASCSSCLA